MKFRFLALLALVLGMASCQKDTYGLDVDANGEAAVTISVALPDVETRAGGNDSAIGAFGNVDFSQYDVRYILQVYNLADGSLAKERLVNPEDEAMETSFTLRLIPGRGYRFVVWADLVAEGKTTDLHYVTTDLKDIQLKNLLWELSDETRDAYTGIWDEETFTSTSNIRIELKRPLGKLRVVTTDIKDMFNVLPEEVTVEYTSSFYTKFNAFTSQVVSDSKAYINNALNAKTINISENKYKNEWAVVDGVDKVKENLTLFADYYFAADENEQEPISFILKVKDNNGMDIPQVVFNTNIPIQRNYLTTVMGPVLTDANSITVVVNDAFANPPQDDPGKWNPEEDEYDVAVWDGQSTNEPAYDPATKTYTIKNGNELAWLAAAVNGTLETRATAAPRTFQGETFKLTKDINLDFNEWTPIGNSTNKFQGTFDGQGHTIANLLITGNNSYVGLFGFTTNGEIKNLVVENAKVSGYVGVGVVAGSPYTSKFNDITVQGHVEVNGFSYVGGVGGRNAYAAWEDITVDVDETSYVNANSVENGTAYRTYVGGVIGFIGEDPKLFKNITSNIDVKGSTIDVGGLFGIAHYGNQFENCSCSGDVEIYAAEEAQEAQEIGGIAGVWNNGGADVVFTNCTFTGTLRTNIAVDFYYGGLIGKPYSATGTGKLIIDGYEMVATGVGLKDGEYYIQSVAGLKWLAEQVNGGNNFSKKVVKLATDLDLNNEEWTPIGLTEDKSFRGAFDGQGKTIYNLRIDSNSRAGLFGYVGRDSGSNDGNVYGAIRNLKLHNVNMKTSSGAALCGNLFRGEISDIELTGKVTIEGTNQNVAGVVGYHYGNLANITVDVTEDSYVKSATGYCGGVASYSGEGDYTKTNIESNIKVIASGEAVGGLFALLQYGNSATDCSCSATVINDCAVDSHNRYVRTGGIAGCWVENASAKTTLTGCEFTGTVKATRQDGLTASKLAHGGLVGASYSTAGYGELNIDGKKYVDVYKSAGLANAVKLEGYTIYMTAGPWGDGVNITEYTMPTSIADNVTIEGVKEAILNMNNISEISGADNLTIDGITVNWNGNTYSGFTHSTGHVYKNITFNGAFFCWNQSARFENCTFNLNANQYIWTYGCNVDFERCTFNCVDGKGILIYNEGTDVTVNINNCEFSSSKHAQTGNGQNIAAIEISNAVNNPKFTVSINNCVSKGGFAYDDFICRFKDEVTAENLANLNVTVDGLKYVSEGKFEDAEGNTIATNVAGLKDALKEGEDVILAGDMAVKSSESESNGYGKTGFNMTNGGTIDGGGNDISINAWSTWDSVINTTGGTIKNINVTGGMRGIFVNHNSDNCSKVYLENVVIDGTIYTISCDQGTNNGLEATNSTFNGWTSYAATIGDVKFTNCNFGEGQGYAYCRPYAPTEFVGCEFEADFTLEPSAAVTFENCTLNGVALTDANIADLVTDTANVTIK